MLGCFPDNKPPLCISPYDAVERASLENDTRVLLRAEDAGGWKPVCNSRVRTGMNCSASLLPTSRMANGTNVAPRAAPEYWQPASTNQSGFALISKPTTNLVAGANPGRLVFWNLSSLCYRLPMLIGWANDLWMQNEDFYCTKT